MPPHDLGQRQSSTSSTSSTRENSTEFPTNHLPRCCIPPPNNRRSSAGGAAAAAGGGGEETSAATTTDLPYADVIEDEELEEQSITSRRCCWQEQEQQQPQQTISRNVTIILIYTWFMFAGRSIWNQNVLVILVALLKNDDPKAVGYATAAMGISQLLMSIPSGILADKYRRDIMLRLASLIGFSAIIITLFGALAHTSYTCLVIALIVWGSFWGVANTSLSALFADSIEDGQRAHYFTSRSILINLGNTIGPTISLIMFWKLGDAWTILDCCKVMSVGQIVCMPAICLLWLLNDDATVVHNNNVNNDNIIDEEDSQRQQQLRVPLLDDTERDDEENSRRRITTGQEENSSDDIGRPDTEDDVTPTAQQQHEQGQQRLSSSSLDTSNNNNTTTDHETFDKTRLVHFIQWLPENRAVPILVASADVTAGLASGMSIRYFSIFLYSNLNLSPVKVQSLYIIAPLIQATLMKVAQYLAKSLGRCRTAVIFKWIGISLMLSMVATYINDLPIWLTCTILVVRTAFMNSTSALTKSVLMDNIPKQERAKWSSLESLNMFSWSGSAAIGGILVDYEGIIFNFCVTACLQLLATIPLLILSFYSSKTTTTTTTNSNYGTRQHS